MPERREMVDETAPNLQRSALLTIDMQNDFVLEGAPACVAGTLDVIAPIGEMVERFRQQRRPVVHMIRLYEPDGSDAERGRRSLIREHGPIVAPGSEGSELVDALKPESEVALDLQRLR
ncbi:MAG: isochorismatase family protein, partial [Actinomycetota bacterium]|nr:isochorismatase family protein [Actinomycetota bacterium]